jgi:hypothetical protein
LHFSNQLYISCFDVCWKNIQKEFYKYWGIPEVFAGHIKITVATTVIFICVELWLDLIMRWRVPEVCAETKTEHSEAEALFLFLGQRTNLELNSI